MESRTILILFSCSLPFLFVNGESNEAVVKAPENYWEKFPEDGAEFDKIVVKIHTTEVMNPLFPSLFVKDHPEIKEFTIDDRDEVKRLANSITSESRGIAAAKLNDHHRTGAQAMGTISFYRKAEKFDVTIANVGFFMGPDLNDYHLFYSWPLAKLVNDISLKHGPGLCQGGFNSLCGARSITIYQYSALNRNEENLDWDSYQDRFNTYEKRPANVWDMFPDADEWPEKNETRKQQQK